MAWTSPRTWSSEVLSSTTLNTHLRDNLLYICGTDGNLDLTATGPHVVGGSSLATTQFLLTGSFAPSNADCSILQITSSISPQANRNAHGVVVTPTIVEAGSGTHALFAGTVLNTPVITAGSATLGNAVNLYVSGMPSEASFNACVYIDAVGNDGIHIALSDSTDVAHGITGYVPTQVYAFLQKQSATAGGLAIIGLTESNVAIQLHPGVTTEDTTKGGSAVGAVQISGRTKSGTTLTSMGADANIFVVRNEGVGAKFIVDAEGDTHRDGTDNTFDAYDDAMLALAWEHEMSPAKSRVRELFAQFCQYNSEALEQAGILHPPDPVTGRRFYNESALLRVATGGVWQSALKMRDLEDRIARLEAR